MELYNIQKINEGYGYYSSIDLDYFLTDKEEVENYCRRLQECKEHELEYRKKLSRKIKVYSSLLLAFFFLCFCYTVYNLVGWVWLFWILFFQGLGIVGIGALIAYLFDMIDDYAKGRSIDECIPRNPYVERYLSEREWYLYIYTHLGYFPEDKRQKMYDYLKENYSVFDHDIKWYKNLGIKI